VSEQDYFLFSGASRIVSMMWGAVMFDEGKEINSKLRSKVEEVAEWFLAKMG